MRTILSGGPPWLLFSVRKARAGGREREAMDTARNRLCVGSHRSDLSRGCFGPLCSAAQNGRARTCPTEVTPRAGVRGGGPRTTGQHRGHGTVEQCGKRQGKTVADRPRAALQTPAAGACGVKAVCRGSAHRARGVWPVLHWPAVWRADAHRGGRGLDGRGRCAIVPHLGTGRNGLF